MATIVLWACLRHQSGGGISAPASTSPRHPAGVVVSPVADHHTYRRRSARSTGMVCDIDHQKPQSDFRLARRAFRRSILLPGTGPCVISHWGTTDARLVEGRRRNATPRFDVHSSHNTMGRHAFRFPAQEAIGTTTPVIFARGTNELAGFIFARNRVTDPRPIVRPMAKKG